MKQSGSPRLAFVIPWFGFDIPGGAESFCRDLALNLSKKGYLVEILTTCAKELASNWNVNHHRPGRSKEKGLGIHRFPVTPGDHLTFNSLNQRLLNGGSLSLEEEQLFLGNIINSDALCTHIEETRDTSWFFFIPYMFGTTYWGVRAAGHRSVLIPCLHDESYATLECIRELFERVPAILFNSEPESRLANRLYALESCDQMVFGIGVEPRPASMQAPPVEAPYVLYVGRRDSGKNTDLLVQYFQLYKRLHPSNLKLVLAGSGQVELGDDCIDLGFVDESRRQALMKHALVLCQPSVNESFSKVIMESWLEETPALVHGNCPVTQDHVSKSEGGLWFSDYFEFEACLEFFSQNPQPAHEMAKKGRQYVQEHYSWNALIRRFDDWFRDLRSRPQSRGSGIPA